MTLKEISTLYDYDKWATTRILDLVQPLTNEQLYKDLGSSHGGIHGTLVHTYSADWIWLERWMGNSPTAVLKVEDFPSFALLREKWEGHFAEIALFIESLSDEKLQAPLAYKDIKGNPYTQPLTHQMQHKVNHSSYHRGQVVTMLRQLGVKPQSTDLINYYRLLQK